ncbi:phage portal protein [Nocardioides sp. ChNu-153]|uniref:phage portal protein n=1 Tax=Nocardioides sp. ChNu-153 TaxID=2779364 RepID=UPI00264DC76D|nr:phage portal protein [Nocardioides sp. ChNu-153]MDN7120294.1 phage portal protein [Nocardioides sp. ChNu-153]
MALDQSEIDLLNRLRARLGARRRHDELMWRYYLGQQRIEQLGMAIPPEMRRFLVITNWCRTLVDTINDRQQVRSLVLPGQETADGDLRAIWDANNLSAHFSMFNIDRQVFGRGFLTVGSNERDEDLPLVRVESPRQMTGVIDARSEQMTAAARFFRSTNVDGARVSCSTLYRPNVTVHTELRRGRWVEVDRDEHNLGAVPVVMHLNRRVSGEWEGESQMSDLIPLVDAAARSLTNLQFAQEAHGVPSIWATGIAKGDFVDDKGQPVPLFEAYFDAIKILTSKEAKWGQFSQADLKNFQTALEIYGKEAANVSGFPARYFGLLSSNPPAEGAIRADEARLVRSVERQNEELGMSLGWVGALAMRFRTGEWVTGNRVRVEWFDPATPTVSQREDALAKRHAQKVLSREGYWDELGWSEARKAKEREYFAAEAGDPTLESIDRTLRNADPAGLGE